MSPKADVAPADGSKRAPIPAGATTTVGRVRRRSSRLLLRLYAIGIVTMVAVGATMVATRVFRERSRRPLLARTALGLSGIAEYLPDEQAADAGRQPAREPARPRTAAVPGEPSGPPPTTAESEAGLRDTITRLRRDAEIWLSLYTPDGRLIATNLEPPLPPPTPDELLRGADDFVTRPGMTIVVPIRRGGVARAYGVARPAPPPHRRELAVDVPIALAWIGLAALLLSRTLARPLEKIAAAARAFGNGKLSVRTGVERDDEIGDVARAFDEMSERIAKLHEAQYELLASVSHELRTPLSRIRVALDLAEEGDAETARASLGDVTEDLTEIETLIEDIFSAARLEMGPTAGGREVVPLNRSDVAVSDLVQKAVGRLRGQFANRPFMLNVDPACVDGRIHVDAMLVRRALENVLENAQKYSPAEAPVRTAVLKVGDAYLIQIADRGYGIGPADLPRVFSPFFRVDRSRTRATGGVGLGLALAKRVIEAHGGTIELVSELDVGTTVTFVLPASGP